MYAGNVADVRVHNLLKTSVFPTQTSSRVAPNGAIACFLCATGQYSSAGNSSCAPCALDTVSAPGSSACTACPKEQRWDPSKLACTPWGRLLKKMCTIFVKSN